MSKYNFGLAHWTVRHSRGQWWVSEQAGDARHWFGPLGPGQVESFIAERKAIFDEIVSRRMRRKHPAA